MPIRVEVGAEAASVADDDAMAADPAGEPRAAGGVAEDGALIASADFCASSGFKPRLMSLLRGRARGLGIDVPRDIRMTAEDWEAVMTLTREHESRDAEVQAERTRALMSALQASQVQVELDRSNLASSLASVQHLRSLANVRQAPGARPDHYLMQGGKAIVVPWGTNAALDALTEAIYRENDRFVTAVMPTLRKYLPR